MVVVHHEVRGEFPMRKLFLVLLAAASCTSNEYSEGALALKWKPPPGVELQGETKDGNVTTAKFTGGVEVRSVTGTPPEINADLDKLKELLVSGAKLALPGEARSGKAGTIPAGPTVRWEMFSGDDRSLIYYVPGKDRYVLLTMTAPASQFNKRSDKMELSMGSLKLQ